MIKNILIIFALIGAISCKTENGNRLFNEGKIAFGKNDYSTAIKLFKSSAKYDNRKAEYILGKCFDGGIGVGIDKHQAFNWYLKAANHGMVSAQCDLGYCYLNGEGVLQNYSEAFIWLNKAANQGDPYAQFNLAIMYHEGKGINKDLGEAIEWLKRSANNGLLKAQFNLANCYRDGDGVIQNYVDAYAWFSVAATQGFENAAQYRDQIAREMSPTSLEKAQELAKEIYMKLPKNSTDKAGS